MKKFSILVISLCLLFAGCSDDGGLGAGFIPNDDSNPNPNPNPGPDPETSCLSTYEIAATFDEDPALNPVDKTFYFEADIMSFVLVDSDCPFAVDTESEPFKLAVGRVVKPNPAVDLFGVFFKETLILGQATTVAPDHLTFTMTYPETPSLDPNCTLAAEIPGDIAAIVGGGGYALSATVPIVLRHASDIGACAGVLANF